MGVTTLNPTDFLDFESELSSTQKAVLQAARTFAKNELSTRIQKAYREEDFPKELAARYGAAGLLGSNLSGYGLPGLDELSYGLIMRELERVDSGYRSFASVQGSLVMYPIFAYGSEAQKKDWLPRLGSGQAIGCFGLTESEGGSDPSQMRTQAVLEGDSWTLNGSKMWITNGNLADVAIVWAKTVDGIRGFVVPTTVAGFKATPMKNKLSLRASNTAELFFDDVKLPKDALLPKSKGLSSALGCLTQARYGIAWGVLGAAESCLSEAIGFAKEREIFGRKLAGFQLAQRKLAKMCVAITQAQWVAMRLAQLKQSGKLHFAHVSLAKQANVEMALEVARTARDVLGANGIMDEYSTMRHMCNLETVYTYEGTNDIHLLVVGKELTGIAGFS